MIISHRLYGFLVTVCCTGDQDNRIELNTVAGVLYGNEVDGYVLNWWNE